MWDKNIVFVRHAVLLVAAVTVGLPLFGVRQSLAQVVVYDDNTGTFAGSGATPGGVIAGSGTTRYTGMIADDLTYTSGAGQAVTQFKFTVANFNSASASATEGVTFWNSNGAGNGPGTVLASFSFTPVAVASGNITTLTYTVPAGQQFILPSSGTIWAGEYFSSSTDSKGTLNNLGQGLYTAPTVGSSLDEAFYSTSTGPFTSSNPSGSITTGPYDSDGYVADFGWQLSIPESADFGWVGGALGLALGVNRLRRRNFHPIK